HQPETPVATRLLLLETMARASLERVPDYWVEVLGHCLQDPEEKVVRQAVATIQAARVTRFDDDLISLTRNKDRPTDLRVAALAVAAARLPKLEPATFDFLVAQIDLD